MWNLEEPKVEGLLQKREIICKINFKNGESNGLDIILDAEQFNYGFNHQNIDSNGVGFKLTLHDHRDKPMIQFSSQLIHTGTETQIDINPVVTYTTDSAVNR